MYFGNKAYTSQLKYTEKWTKLVCPDTSYRPNPRVLSPLPNPLPQSFNPEFDVEPRKKKEICICDLDFARAWQNLAA
jgi:hypothetical protein